MKFRTLAWLACLLVIVGSIRAEEELMDRLADALVFSSPSGDIRGRLSGMIDVEAFRFPQPAPALIDAEGHELFNPRFTTFFDLQASRYIYAFAQVRLDRGFDPAADSLRGRIDEYAVRFTPWLDGRCSLQVGKFATVVGNWVSRHGSWDNPFISAPLPYEHLTGIWDVAAARSSATLLQWAHVAPPLPEGSPAGDKYLRLPILWGPSYAPGISMAGALRQFEYAVEVKGASLSSRPSAWSETGLHWRHPTVSGRLGYRPSARWNWGLSASDGSYLTEAATRSLPVGRGRGDYREMVLGQDLSFAWHHLQIWAEVFEARFLVPGVGDADTCGYYLESRYKISPRVAVALRWNEQLFGLLADGMGGSQRWGSNLWRLDLAPTFRMTAHAQLKFQYSLEHETIRTADYAHLLAVQFTLKF